MMVRLVCSINLNSNGFVTHANKAKDNLGISVGDLHNPALSFLRPPSFNSNFALYAFYMMFQ